MINNINKANIEFWDQLCSTGLAEYLGIKDNSPESIKIFDDWYLNFYPYLLKHIELQRMAGKKVLEIGLGYGTLGQKIAEIGADYVGLDIAEGPVKMMNHRLRDNRLAGRAIQGSMLECPLKSESLDFLISIGCFHHTGNIKRCIDETYRVLKKGGSAVIMLYNRFSYRQWLKWPKQTFLALMQNFALYKEAISVTEEQRKAYDTNTNGRAAPETIFLSVKQVKEMFSKYRHVKFYKENCDQICFKNRVLFPREKLLPVLGRTLGLDIYIKALK